MNLLLDTSVIIDVLRNRGGRAAILEQVVREGALLCSCDITLAEVYSGMHERERRRTEEFLGSLSYVASEPAIAREAGLLRRDWRKRGVTLTLPDMFLAALALRRGLTLVTDNTKHFPIPSLALRTPEGLVRT
jgi:hypothetical protein